MKIEYKLIEKIHHGMVNNKPYIENIYGLYITKNELIKNYENNKDHFIDKIINLTEMLTVPHCFHTYFWYKNYNYIDGYDYDKFNELITLIKKTSVKGLLLSVQENQNNDKNFIVEIIKK